MASPKSFIYNVTVDTVSRAHNCQHNKRHRLTKGEKRLKVKKNRTHEHYCVECAIKFIELDIQKLKSIVRQLKDES